MEKIIISSEYTFDEVIDILLECQKNNKSVFIDYNGTLLFSDGLTADFAYLIYYGVTKLEYKNNVVSKYRYEKIKEMNEMLERTKNNFGISLNQSMEYIIPEMKENWEYFYKKYETENLNNSFLLKLIIILKGLYENISINGIIALINDFEKNNNYNKIFIISIMLRYSSRGNELFDAYIENSKQDDNLLEETDVIRRILRDKTKSNN